MAKDYVPRKLAEFNEWQENLVDHVEINATKWNIPKAEVEALTSQRTIWSSAYINAKNPDTRTSAKVKLRQQVRKSYEKFLRDFIQEHLAKNHRVTLDDKILLGIHIPDPVPTPSPEIVTFPVLKVDTSLLQQHRITAHDSEKETRGKPDRVKNFELWRKLGDLPTEDGEWEMVAVRSSASVKLRYDMSQKGLFANYRGRWVGAKEIVGPWSEVVRAVIP
jgi:hypothetical protein